MIPDKNSHNKPILIRTSNPDDGLQPQFEVDAFDKAIGSKGHDVYIEKAMRCPCSIDGANNSLLTCKNCGGVC